MQGSNDKTTFTVRITREMLEKFHYISDYEGRSSNKEMIQLIKKHIAEFEAKHGKINE